MRKEINRKDILVLEVILESVRSLYCRVPGAYLLHADFEWSERKYDDLNWSGSAKVNFTVSVSPALKVDLCAMVRFSKTEWEHAKTKEWKRCEGGFTITHEESGKSVQMATIDTAHVWDQENGEDFREMIGNPRK